jgi:hypothetical protein
VPWSNLYDHLKELNRRLVRVKGNGFCLLNAIITALFIDHDIIINTETLKQMIKAHLLLHGEQYVEHNMLSTILQLEKEV